MTAVICATGLAAPALSEAVLYKGRTDQGKPAAIRATPEGQVQRVRVTWRAPCVKPGRRWLGTTLFRPPFDVSAPRRARDKGFTRSRDDNRIVGTIFTSMTVRRVAPRRWVGGLRARVVVRRDGRVLDRCRLSGTRFTVRAGRARGR